MDRMFAFETTGEMLKKWRNLATGECRLFPPDFGELDWVEVPKLSRCPD